MGTNKVESLKRKAICSNKQPGSIHGPLLFLLFINDLPEMMQEFESYGYADDFKAIAHNKNDIKKVRETTQKWLETNKMQLNTKKSHILNIKESVKAKNGGGRPRISQVSK